MNKLTKGETQTSLIQELIEKYMKEGYTDKTDIFSKVVEETGIPRPTVRRAAKQFREKLQEHVRILSAISKVKQ